MFVELKMTVLSANQNIPLACHDSLSPTIGQVFPDSQIALKYHSASIKATCMLSKTLAPFLQEDLKSALKPFSICIDGSNDTGLEKMNTITMQIFDVKSGKIVNLSWTCAKQLALQQKQSILH